MIPKRIKGAADKKRADIRPSAVNALILSLSFDRWRTSVESLDRIGLSARPQVISYVLVVITVDAWLRAADDSRARWWLVPMTWVWAMCHGMWPVGIAIGGIVLIGMALDRRTTMRRWWLLACVPALSAAVRVS